MNNILLEENQEPEFLQTWPEVYYRKLLVKTLVICLGLVIIPFIGYLSHFIP